MPVCERIAVISDVHANFDALRRVLADAHTVGVDGVVCLGDIVGYGPLPKETLSLVQSTCRITVAGNHDDAVSGRGDASNFIELAGDAVSRHHDALSSEDLKWLAALPYVATCGEATLVHGDLTNPEAFNYIKTTSDAKANFSATDSKLIFVGHTHEPCLFLVGHSGTVYLIDPQDFTMEQEKRYIVNPGSVGYPREKNGKCYSSYVIYDIKHRTISYRFVPFAVSSVMQRGVDTPRRSGRLLWIAVLATTLAAAIGISVAAVRHKPQVRTEIREVDVEEKLVLERKTIPLDIPLASPVAYIRANLILAKDSKPISLKIEFTDADGKTISTLATTVTVSKRKKEKVPHGASKAVLTIYKINENDNPVVEVFSPSLE